jgi:hypothetical protein
MAAGGVLDKDQDNGRVVVLVGQALAPADEGSCNACGAHVLGSPREGSRHGIRFVTDRGFASKMRTTSLRSERR